MATTTTTATDGRCGFWKIEVDGHEFAAMQVFDNIDVESLLEPRSEHVDNLVRKEYGADIYVSERWFDSEQARQLCISDLNYMRDEYMSYDDTKAHDFRIVEFERFPHKLEKKKKNGNGDSDDDVVVVRRSARLASVPCVNYKV